MPAPPWEVSPSAAESFARDGVLHLPGALPPDLLARLRAAVDAAAASDDPNELDAGAMRFVSNVHRRVPGVADVVASPALVAIVTALLGPSGWLRWDQAVWKHPGAPEFPLHQDNGYTGRPAVHLQLWCALTPTTRENGALEVVPGRHRSVEPHAWVGAHAVAEVDGPVRVVEAEPGDVIAFSSLLPHRTGPNVSSTSRLAFVAEVLPVGTADPGVDRPHLVVCADGRPHGGFVADAGAGDLRPVASPAPAPP